MKVRFDGNLACLRLCATVADECGRCELTVTLLLPQVRKLDSSESTANRCDGYGTPFGSVECSL